MKNTIDAPTQASQEKRLSEDGYEYVGNKGDTIIVGLDHDVAPTCSRSIHKSRFGTFREATVGDWQCRRCGRVVKEESFERISKSIGYRWPLCACSTWKFENSDWRKLREKDIFSENTQDREPAE
jgi:hypothetical protein